MGEGWKQKAGKRYRHHLQRSTAEFTLPNLFDSEEDIQREYIGHLLSNETGIMPDDELYLYLHSKKAFPTLVQMNEVIGRIEGESALDLQDRLAASSCWPAIMTMRVVRCERNSDAVILAPTKKAMRK